MAAPLARQDLDFPQRQGDARFTYLSLVRLNFLYNMALKDMENFDVEVRNLGIVVLAFKAENFGKAGSLRSPYLCRKQG